MKQQQKRQPLSQLKKQIAANEAEMLRLHQETTTLRAMAGLERALTVRKVRTAKSYGEKAIDRGALMEVRRTRDKKNPPFAVAVFHAIGKAKSICGYPLDNAMSFTSHEDGEGWRYHVHAYKGEQLMVIESISSLSVAKVQNFAKRLSKESKRGFWGDKKECTGVIVYEYTDDEGKAVAAALQQGFIVAFAQKPPKPANTTPTFITDKATGFPVAAPANSTNSTNNPTDNLTDNPAENPAENPANKTYTLTEIKTPSQAKNHKNPPPKPKSEPHSPKTYL